MSIVYREMEEVNFAQGISLAGVTVTSSAAELNILDGVTATTAEINKLAGNGGATSMTVIWALPASGDALVATKA